jgi:hypothetical protein
MSDRIFYVGAQDANDKFTGYVPAKFLTINGQPIVDPMPGGLHPTPSGLRRRLPYIYADDKGTMKSDDANPNNYMIVPANFDEERARAYAERIGKLKSAYGLTAALTEMLKDFKRSGSQDLQRGSQWGIPEGSFVPAFTSAASHYLGFVSGLQDIPLEFAKIGGGLQNLFDPNNLFKPNSLFKKDTSGPYGLSQQNYRSLMQGKLRRRCVLRSG